MSYFIFPQSWITPAIAAAAIAFGSLDASPVKIIYRNLDGESLGESRPPRTIAIDKRGLTDWTREKAQCVIIHEYAHLRDKQHSKNRRSIMYPVLTYPTCHRWLLRHGIE